MTSNVLRKKYSISQLYRAILLGYVSFPWMVKNKKEKRVDAKLIERLMLATTEVNGCEVCSYAHTQMALKEGFSQDEINAFLSGSNAYVMEEEAIAILYAQHVADTMGNPDPITYDRLIDIYGSTKAAIMKSAIMIMMMGNIAGIPLSALLRRLKGKPYINSSLGYEIGMLLIQPVFMIAAIPHALLLSMFSKEISIETI